MNAHSLTCVAITGSSGFIGSALVAALNGQKIKVKRIVRHPSSHPDEVFWDTTSGTLEIEKLADVDAIVHLAGESIVQRWTPEVKARLRASRVDATAGLARAVAAMEKPPRLFLSASGAGFYGDREDEFLDEESSRGQGFLATLAKDWEDATHPLQGRSRISFARFGILLSPHGGALKKMLPAFKFGLGAVLGDGTQYMSWISLHDAVRAIIHILTHELEGPINVVAPNPATNYEFTKCLGRSLHRPAFMFVPSSALKLIIGEMGKDLLLASQRIAPKRLLESHFTFEHPTLERALDGL